MRSLFIQLAQYFFAQYTRRIRAPRVTSKKKTQAPHITITAYLKHNHHTTTHPTNTTQRTGEATQHHASPTTFHPNTDTHEAWGTVVLVYPLLFLKCQKWCPQMFSNVNPSKTSQNIVGTINGHRFWYFERALRAVFL